MSEKQPWLSRIMWLIGPIFLWVFVPGLFSGFAVAGDYALIIVSTLTPLAAAILMWQSMRKKYIDKYALNVNLLIVVVLVSIVLCLALNTILTFSFWIVDIDSIFPSHKEVSDIYANMNIPVLIIFVSILTPVSEEFLLRGIVLNRALKWMKPWVAIIVSAAIFGIMHMNLLQSMYAFIGGLLQGYIYVKFRSIIAPIAGHMAFNSCGTILDAVLPEDIIALIEQNAVTFNEVSVILIPAIIVFAACIVVLLILPKAKFVEASKYDRPRVEAP